MNKYFSLAVGLALLWSCGSGVQKPSQDATDSAHTVAIDSSLLPSPNVDNLFNDFVYEFMNNPTFQLTRVRFPLSYDKQTYTMQTWHHDSIFANESYYVVLCSTPEEMALEKSVDLHNASVYWLYPDKRVMLDYTFERNADKQWMLTRLENKPMERLDKDSFYTFYHQFVTDEAFQNTHIAKRVKYTYFNEESQRVEQGFITAEQWPEQKPELPEGNIAVVHYGQAELSGKHRYLMLRGLSNGLATTITFEQRGATWYVVGVDN